MVVTTIIASKSDDVRLYLLCYLLIAHELKKKKNFTANNASNVTVDAFTTTSPLIADTAATGHFAEMNASFIKNIKLADSPISILCPSGAFIKSTHNKLYKA